MTATADGGLAADNPDRTAGSWAQTIGSAKEAVGGLVGSESLKQAGQQQHAEGQQQEARGQLQDLGDGLSNRVQGTLGSVKTSILGEGSVGEKEKFEQQRQDGKAQQRSVEADLQSKAEAQ